MLAGALKCKARLFFFCSFQSNLSAQCNSLLCAEHTVESMRKFYPRAYVYAKATVLSFALCKLQLTPVRAPLEKIVIARENKRSRAKSWRAAPPPPPARANCLHKNVREASVLQTKPQGAPLGVVCALRGGEGGITRRRCISTHTSKAAKHFCCCRIVVSRRTLVCAARRTRVESGVKMQKRKKHAEDAAGNTRRCPDDLAQSRRMTEMKNKCWDSGKHEKPKGLVCVNCITSKRRVCYYY
jgi:hypothetical protein